MNRTEKDICKYYDQRPLRHRDGLFCRSISIFVPYFCSKKIGRPQSAISHSFESRSWQNYLLMLITWIVQSVRWYIDIIYVNLNSWIFDCIVRAAADDWFYSLSHENMFFWSIFLHSRSHWSSKSIVRQLWLFQFASSVATINLFRIRVAFITVWIANFALFFCYWLEYLGWCVNGNADWTKKIKHQKWMLLQNGANFFLLFICEFEN